MKALKEYSLATILAWGLTVSPQAQQEPPEPADPAPAAQDAGDAPADSANVEPANTDSRPAGGRRRGREEAQSDNTSKKPEAAADLKLNFRNAPLDLVLNYLSDAAGFVIVLETEVKGKVDVWSNRTLTADEAVDVLNSVLNKNGYAAIRNERTLTIVKKDDARKRDIPVRSGSDPKRIPKNDEMVTQVIPVRHANATQMTKDLQPLLPSEANLTANESGNALVITDTQANIRRMAEIVRALDTSISSVSTVKVFPLKYADAKELANSIKDLFASNTSTTGNNNNGGGGRAQQFFNRFGGGGPGGGGGGQGGNANAASQSAVTGAKVTAVADERTNSLVVSAPEESMPTVERLVLEIDVSATDITELRVFHLINADPLEVADIFTQLFSDTTSTDQNQNNGFRFGGGPFGGPGGGNRANTAQTSSSDRMKKKGKVSAVADQRTSSIIVSAASELMPQITQMITQLDSSPARKQRVFVYSLENADVQEVEQILRDMFDRNGTSSSRTGTSQNSALTTRSQQAINNTTTGTGTTGFGNNSGTGGGLR